MRLTGRRGQSSWKVTAGMVGGGGVGELSAWCEAEGISRGRGPRGSRSSRSF